MDPIRRDQEAIALRQLIEQTYAQDPRVLEALRANADALDLELRGLPPGTQPAEVEKIVLADPEVTRRLEGLSVRKVIVVKDRIVNIVVAG